MNVYPIPKLLENEYKGSGHGFASISEGQIVAIKYLRHAHK